MTTQHDEDQTDPNRPATPQPGPDPQQRRISGAERRSPLPTPAQLWRQGDVLISAVDALPEGAELLDHGNLAIGQMTTHRHRIEDLKTARVYRTGRELFLEVRADWARIVHPEHGTITPPTGSYRVWVQREYSEFGIRDVMD